MPVASDAVGVLPRGKAYRCVLPFVLFVAACGVQKGGLTPSDGARHSGGQGGGGGGRPGQAAGGARATGGTNAGGARTGGGEGTRTETGGAGAGGAAIGGAATGGAGTGGAATGGAGTGGAATGGAGTGGAGTGGAATGGAGTGGAGTGGAGTGGAATGGAGTGGAGTGATGTGGAGTGGAGTGGAGTGGAGTGGAATGGTGTGGAGTGGAPGNTFNAIFATSAQFTLDELAAKGAGSSPVDMAAAVLAGADVACAQSAAAPGSLAPPGKYVAWISSAAANARDRLKAAAGGVMPRGWVRLDGRPFLDELPAATADQYVVPATLYPVKFDEKGAVTFNWTFTATDTRGLFTPGFSCLNWTDRSSPPTTTYAWAGHPDAGVSVWTMWYATYCSTRNSLYCMQVDHANPIPPQQAPLNAKRVFVSRYATPGAGLAGADASCSAAAAAAGLTGVFKALIAPTGASAASRFHPDGGRAFVRTDGVVVSATDTALFAGAFGTILAPIVVDARGAYTDGTVFTGAANVGDAGSLNCGNWTTASSASTTYAAFACFSGARVFQGTLTRSCDSADSIFCVQD